MTNTLASSSFSGSAEMAANGTDLQQQRYLLPAKGGDGDPPYALDMSRNVIKVIGERRKELTDEFGRFRYRRDGD